MFCAGSSLWRAGGCFCFLEGPAWRLLWINILRFFKSFYNKKFSQFFHLITWLCIRIPSIWVRIIYSLMGQMNNFKLLILLPFLGLQSKKNSGLETASAEQFRFWMNYRKAVFRIRTGFSADPNPAFYLDPDPDPASQTNAEPNSDPGQTLKSQKFGFWHEKCTSCRYRNVS